MLNLDWNIIWTFVNIIILFILLKKFLFGPVTKMMEERAGEIKASFDDAEQVKKEAEALRIAYAKRLEKSKAAADSIIKDAEAEAQEKGEEIIDKARQDAEIMIKDAEKYIELEKERSLKEARAEIAGVALCAAQKAMESGDISDSSINSFIKQVGDTVE